MYNLLGHFLLLAHIPFLPLSSCHCPRSSRRLSTFAHPPYPDPPPPHHHHHHLPFLFLLLPSIRLTHIPLPARLTTSLPLSVLRILTSHNPSLLLAHLFPPLSLPHVPSPSFLSHVHSPVLTTCSLPSYHMFPPLSFLLHVPSPVLTTCSLPCP